MEGAAGNFAPSRSGSGMVVVMPVMAVMMMSLGES